MSTQNNVLNLRLPASPQAVDDPKLYAELIQIYNAIKNMQYGLDQFLDIPPNYESADYIWSILDRGRSIDCGAGCTAITIPLDTTPASFNPGATTIITNISGAAISIVPTSGVSLILAGTATTGTRTLANFGVSTMRYVSNNTWIIAGAGVS